MNCYTIAIGCLCNDVSNESLIAQRSINEFIIKLICFSRARVKGGMRILGAQASSDDWNVSVEKENPKHTVARVTAFRKDQDPDSTTRQQDDLSGNK